MDNPEEWQQWQQQKLIELCYLMVEKWNAEQAYDRAQWKVSYYRKRKRNAIPGNYSKMAELDKKIEQTRLLALVAQKQLLETKKRLMEPLAKVRGVLGAAARYSENGRVEGVWIPNFEDDQGGGKEFGMDKIVEMVEQHEANMILTEVLKDTEV